MKIENESKSLARLMTNLANDPDIQLANEIKAGRESLETDDPTIEILRERVHQAARAAFEPAKMEQQTPVAAETRTASPFPRWNGRNNLPKGLEDFINSAADMLFAKEECLALSADTPATKFQTKVWRVADNDMRLLLSVQADPRKLALVVTDANGELSHNLDGAKLVSTNGAEIAEIRDRSALLDAAMMKNDFIMISPVGSPITLKPE